MCSALELQYNPCLEAYAIFNLYETLQFEQKGKIARNFNVKFQELKKI